MSQETIIGKKVKDKITGFVGTCTARTEFYCEEPSVRVEAPTLESGKPVVCWFQEARVEVQPPGEKGSIGFVEK